MSIEATVIIRNKMGIHARPATELVKLARSYDAEVNLIKEGKTVSASSVLGIMMLGSHCGESITVEASGKDAEQALTAIVGLLETEFDQDSQS